MNKYIISIDSGGTKTKGVLYDDTGNIIREYLAGQSNFAVNYDNAKSVLVDVIHELINEKVSSIYMGIAGFSAVAKLDELKSFFESKFQVKTHIYPDAYLGLYANKESDAPLIHVIAGTGSMIYTLKDDNLYRFGGNGHLFGDTGSAYSISMKLFEDIFETLDLNKKLNPLQKEALKKAKATNRAELLSFIYQKNKSEIAEFASLISSYVSLKYSQKLLKNEAKKISSQILNAYKKSKMNEAFILVLKGGFVEKAPLVKEEIIKILEKKKLKFKLNMSNREAVYGGYQLYRLQNRRD